MKIRLRLLEAVNYSYYKDKISEEKYNELVQYDPTPDKKYAAWLLNKYIGNKETKAHVEGTRWYIISQLLKDYDTYKSRNVIPAPFNDINKFPSTVALSTYIKENEEEFTNLIKAKQTSKGKDVRIIFKDALNLVVIPLSHEASRKYGTGTNWCTASASEYHYNAYTKDGVLYIHRFLNEDGSFKEEAYQLYIPREDAYSHDKVECNDYANDKVSSIEDTFLSDLPDEITEEFEKKIEKAGGYEKEFTILGNVYSETENGKTRVRYSYELVEIIDGDYEWEMLDETSFVTIQLVGNGIPIPEEENELQMALLDSDSFNFENGTGILLQIEDKTPEEARSEADKRWRDKVGYWDEDTDDYEARHEIEYLKKYSIDYFVINRKSDEGIGDDLENLLDPYIGDIMEQDQMSLDVGGEKYTIYFKTGYEYSSSGDWVSTPRQRRRDKQLDFPEKRKQTGVSKYRLIKG
jgi:hypothetical protein